MFYGRRDEQVSTNTAGKVGGAGADCKDPCLGLTASDPQGSIVFSHHTVFRTSPPCHLLLFLLKCGLCLMVLNWHHLMGS